MLYDIPTVLSTLTEELATLRKKQSCGSTDKKAFRKALASKDRLLALKDQEIDRLKKEVLELQKQLSKFEVPTKNSTNSSIPSSKSPIGTARLLRTRSLREKSRRITGGQPGHKGSTLELRSVPDRIKPHSCEYCMHCGDSLSALPGQLETVRQVIDLPPVIPIVTEHRVYSKQCSCGHINTADFPETVRARISYGIRIQSLIAYFNTVQCIPYKRMCQMLEECFGLKISQGTIKNILQQMSMKSGKAYRKIRSRIGHSSVVGADETGTSINGKNYWTWVWQNRKLTYVYCNASRGKGAIYKEFPKGLPRATLVTDRHQSYFGIPAKDHQICLAHLLREFTYLQELSPKQTWARRFRELLQEAIHKRKSMKWEEIPRQELQSRLDELLEEPLWMYTKEFWGFRKGLVKYKDYIFKFLDEPDVPYDNNSSEGAIRIIKTKLKVAGCFRSDQGADTFTKLHSIVDTAKKNQMSKYKVLLAIAKMPAQKESTRKIRGG